MGNYSEQDGNKTIVADSVSTNVTPSQLGSPTSSVEFNQQQALQIRIENRTTDPTSPAIGQIWLRTDL